MGEKHEWYEARHRSVKARKDSVKKQRGLLSNCFPSSRQAVITGHLWCSWMKQSLRKYQRDWFMGMCLEKCFPKQRKRSREGGGRKGEGREDYPSPLFLIHICSREGSKCPGDLPEVSPGPLLGNLFLPVRADTGLCHCDTVQLLMLHEPPPWTSQHEKRM